MFACLPILEVCTRYVTNCLCRFRFEGLETLVPFKIRREASDK